ncbi:MAG: FAD-binding oxidoreductase, partial [Nitrospinales bacterium]
MMIRKTDPESVAPYLKDASNFSGGVADEVVIPENVEELRSFLKSNRDPVTVSGAGTGLTASRIPLSGSILSLERFKTIGEIDNASITVGSAVTLHDLQFHLEGSGYFYPPNPTESLASIGGTIATNASGSRSFKFGPTRDYVQELEFVLADGRCARLARNHKIDWPLELSDGSKITFPEVTFQSPLIKNASGYYVRPEMDWLDLFIGSDGTLAVITEAKLRLLPAPVNFISGVIFCSEEKFCWQLVDSIRTEGKDKISP